MIAAESFLFAAEKGRVDEAVPVSSTLVNLSSKETSMTNELICLLAESAKNSILPICGKKVASKKDLTRRMDALEQTCKRRFKIFREVIRQLIKTPVPERNAIGFRSKIPGKKDN
jgi:hypothetical protein